MTGYSYGVTPDFASRIASTFGPGGARWLEHLPGILRRCSEMWSLTIGAPFRLSYNYVARATRADGSPAVLKVCAPNPEVITEIAALQLLDGDGACRLLEHSIDLHAMLLERVEPGESLARLALEDDERATDIAIDLFPRIWKTPPQDHSFPTVATWAQGIDRHRSRFGGGSGPLPAELFEEGAACFEWLLATASEDRLLHGDLHHDNILSATRERWLVIDPKGVVGDPGYELGAFLYNPIPGLLQMDDPGQVLARRIDQLSDGLGMERARIRAWGLAQAVLSACWSVDDDQDWRHAMAVSEILGELDVQG